jgi:general secretion pathway protein J
VRLHLTNRLNCGFTLIEVLIALALSVMLVGMLSSSLHTYAISTAAGQKHIADKQLSESVYQFVGDQLRQVVPLLLRSGRERNVLFHGDDNRITYVGHIPHHRSAGGLHRNSLVVDGLPPHQTLLFNYERLSVDAEFDITTFVESTDNGGSKTLISDARSIEFAYFGAKEAKEDPGWTTEWSVKDRLPQLVRLRIDNGREQSPDEITVPLYANASSKSVALTIGNSAPTSINEMLRQQAAASSREEPAPQREARQ